MNKLQIVAGVIIVVSIVLILLIAISSWIVFKGRMIRVKNGDAKDIIISRIIKKAENTGKAEYTIYRPIAGSLLVSMVYLIIKYITNTYFVNNTIDAGDFLLTFLVMFIVWMIIGIIVSSKIWNICRQE